MTFHKSQLHYGRPSLNTSGKFLAQLCSWRNGWKENEDTTLFVFCDHVFCDRCVAMLGIAISSSRTQRKDTTTKKGRSSPLQKKPTNGSSWHSNRHHYTLFSNTRRSKPIKSNSQCNGRHVIWRHLFLSFVLHKTHIHTYFTYPQANKSTHPPTGRKGRWEIKRPTDSNRSFIGRFCLWTLPSSPPQHNNTAHPHHQINHLVDTTRRFQDKIEAKSKSKSIQLFHSSIIPWFSSFFFLVQNVPSAGVGRVTCSAAWRTSFFADTLNFRSASASSPNAKADFPVASTGKLDRIGNEKGWSATRAMEEAKRVWSW